MNPDYDETSNGSIPFLAGFIAGLVTGILLAILVWGLS